MVFTANQIETPTFGDKLKKYREEAGLTVQKVTQLLNIPAKFLESLERNEFDKLPPEVYSRGFLKKYANLLSIDPEKLLSEYRQEAKINNQAEKTAHSSLPVLRSRGLAVTPRTIGIIVAVVAVILVVGYLFYQLNYLVSPPQLKIFEPGSDITVQQSSIFVRGQTEAGVKLTINGQKVYINRDGSFSQEIKLGQGLNSLIITATNRFGKSSSETRKILLK